MNSRIFELADRKGIKLQHLADELGVKNTKVYDWKRNRATPSAAEIISIANILGTTEAYLLGQTDDPSQSKEKGPVTRDEAKVLLEMINRLSPQDRKLAIDFLSLLEQQRTE